MREENREYRQTAEKSRENDWTEEWVGVSWVIMVINKEQTLLPDILLCTLYLHQAEFGLQIFWRSLNSDHFLVNCKLN